MSTITIELHDEQLQHLKKLAHDAKVSAEDLLRARIEEWLSAPSEDFLKAASYIMKKNEDLYRRLA